MKRPPPAAPLLGALILVAAAAIGPAAATENTLEQTETVLNPAESEDKARRRAREAELETLRRSLEISRARQAVLQKEIGEIEADRTRLGADLIDTARRLQAAERDITAAEARLERLHANEDGIRRSLVARREVLAEILAILQRMGRTPPPALLSRPEDALAAIRGSILAGAVLPGIRIEAEALAADLKELTSLRARIQSERDRLQSQYRKLGEERTRVDLLINSRHRQREETTATLQTERAKAARLAEEAESLQALFGAVEEAAPPRPETAESAGQSTGSTAPAEVASRLSDTGRLAPAIRFADTKGLLQLPVAGSTIQAFGADDGLGGRANGESIGTLPGGRVIAPADGWVAYAGPFRSFGQVLILNAGDGYHVVLAGMARIDVALGQFVLAGEPVAVMGERRIASLGDLENAAAKAILYVEFRKDGVAIDPQPWWDMRDGNEVRG